MLRVLIAVVLAMTAPLRAGDTSPPNILVFMSDDQGYGTWLPSAGPAARGEAGTVTLDSNGEARVEVTVSLSGAELHYQLTCVGGYAPVYIAEKAVDGTFVIAGGAPGMEVSWQVTGE